MNEFSDRFHFSCGVRQGCTVAPSLFLLPMDWVLQCTSHGGFLSDDAGHRDLHPPRLCRWRHSACWNGRGSSAGAGCADVPLSLEVNWQKTKIQSTIDLTTLPRQYLSQVAQLTSWSPLSTLAKKAIPLVAQNQKSATRSVWPKPVFLISLIEEYGAPACPPLLNFSYTAHTFNRSSSVVLKHQLWHQLWNNISLRRILRIPYTDHVTNADVRLWAGSPPQLLPHIQTRRLHFGRVARMGDSHDLFRVLHTSIRRLPKDWRHRLTSGYGPFKPTFSRSTTDWTRGRWKQFVETATLHPGACPW